MTSHVTTKRFAGDRVERLDITGNGIDLKMVPNGLFPITRSPK